MNTTTHFHKTEGEGLRQCTCGCWTVNGIVWASRPEALTDRREAYPGQRGDQHRPITTAMPVLTAETVAA